MRTHHKYYIEFISELVEDAKEIYDRHTDLIFLKKDLI